MEELDSRILQLGDLAWEIGPSRRSEGSSVLVISAGAKPELAERARSIIKAAPNCEGWEFRHTKPPREWSGVLEFTGRDGTRHAIDTSEWRYVLYRFDDGVFDVVVETGPLGIALEDDRLSLGEIVIDSELGEESRTRWVRQVELVEVLGEAESVKSTALRNLGAHLGALTSTDSA